MVLGGILLVSCQPELAPEASPTGSVSFALEEGAATTRANGALTAGSTLRVIAYLRTDGQTGYPDANRRDECTYKVEANGTLKLCAVNADGTVNAAGALPKDMALAPGTYDFYAISPALRIYHEPTNPMVAVKHGVDFASSFTPKAVTAGANNIVLTALRRHCAKLNFKTDRQPTLPDLTKIRVQSLTLEAMTDEPVWATAADTLVLTNNTYASTIRIPGSAFSVPAGNADYQQTADTFCLPRPIGDFRLRAEVLYNADTTPTILETTVSGTAFAAGSSNNLTLYFGYKKIKVEVTNGWMDSSDNTIFGTVDLNGPFGGKTANCYIIANNASAIYNFKADARGNGQESTTDPNLSGISYHTLPVMNTASEARVIWQTGTNASTLLIDPASVKLINRRVYFATTGRVNEGNAVIGIFASSAANAPCVWSWHIWKLDGSAPGDVVCVKDPSPITALANFNMMDRNLGAYNNDQGDVGSVGLLYQWGRKDPFPGTSTWTRIEPNIYGFWNTDSDNGNWDGRYVVQTAPTNLTIGTEVWAVQHPAIFIVSVDTDADWLIDKNNSLWGTPWIASGSVNYYNGNQGTKSIYDPCPVGYRVPPQDTWSKHMGINGIFQNSGIILNNVSPGLWIPAAGIRNCVRGHLGDINAGYYWSSSPYDQTLGVGITFCGADMSFYLQDIGPRNAHSRAYAFSVRCVRE